MVRLRRATASDALSNHVTANTAENDDYCIKFERGPIDGQSRLAKKTEVKGNNNQNLAHAYCAVANVRSFFAITDH